MKVNYQDLVKVINSLEDVGRNDWGVDAIDRKQLLDEIKKIAEKSERTELLERLYEYIREHEDNVGHGPNCVWPTIGDCKCDCLLFPILGVISQLEKPRVTMTTKTEHINSPAENWYKTEDERGI